MGKALDEDLAVRKHLKVFVGGLPQNVSEHQVGTHFSRYGHVLSVNVVQPRDDESKKSAYAFICFKFAADADAAVSDSQNFPGSSRPLAMGFATPRKGSKDDDKSQDGLLNEADPCKLFISGIGERDREEEVGDFFSQWGLVTLVLRQDTWCFVRFATKEGALRLLGEETLMFQRRKLKVKASDSKRGIDDGEHQELLRRALARHFHKKSLAMMPAPLPALGAYPPPGYPPVGYYGAAPGAAPPPAHYGYYPPPGYPQTSAPPPAAGYYGGPPPPGPAGYYVHPEPPPHGGACPYYGGPSPGAPPHGNGEAPKALPAPDYYRTSAPPSSAAGGDPYAGHYARASSAPTTGYYREGGAEERRHEDYYRTPESPGGHPPADAYRDNRDPYPGAPAPSQHGDRPPPGADPYGHFVAGASPPAAYAAQYPHRDDTRHRPY